MARCTSGQLPNLIWLSPLYYLAEHASIETADRFLRNAEESFRDLSRHPEMSASLPLREPPLAGLRRWQIKGLTKFLTFYLPHSDGVTIVRVLHASQAWWDLLGISACLSRRGESRSAARIWPRTQKRALGHALRPAVSPCLHLRRRRAFSNPEMSLKDRVTGGD